MDTELRANLPDGTDPARNRRIRRWIVVGLAFSWLNFATDFVVVPEVWRLSFLLHLCVFTPVSLIAMRYCDAVAFILLTVALGNAINFIPVATHRGAIAYPEVVVTTHVLVGLSFLSRFLAERGSGRSFMLRLRPQRRAEALARSSNAALLDMPEPDLHDAVATAAQ